jgi:acyl-CoA synthetase (AMP-forming)/AMP-acid ligase II
MPTIASTLKSTARRVPDAPALIFGEQRYTYRELDDRVDRTAWALAHLGLAKGDRFALMATNSDAFVVACYAALRLGAIFVPVNPASAPPEVHYLLDDSGATVFVHDPAVAATVDAARAAGLPPTTEQVLTLPELADLGDRAETSTGQLPDTVTESDDALGPRLADRVW